MLAELAAACEPGDETLGVEGEIAIEGMLELAVRQPAAVRACERAPQDEHVGPDPGRGLAIGGVRAGDARERGDLLLERGSEARNIGHPAEVHEVYRLGPQAQHAVDGGDVLLRIELRRYRRGGDECALHGVEGTIGDAEGVAAENAGV